MFKGAFILLLCRKAYFIGYRKEPFARDRDEGKMWRLGTGLGAVKSKTDGTRGTS